MGVIAIIYESRPNVTSDAAALALKSGNVCVLRSGREAYRSAAAITAALRRGLERTGLTPDLVNLVEDTSHAGAAALMTATGYVDLLIPRGGQALSARASSTRPCRASRPARASAMSMSTRAPIFPWRLTSSKTQKRAARPSAMRPRSCSSTAPSRRGSCPCCKSACAARCKSTPSACAATKKPQPSSASRRTRSSTRNFWTMCWLSASWTTWRSHPPHRAAFHAPQRGHRHAKRGQRRPLHGGSGQRGRLCQRLDALHGRRRIRPRLRDGHLDAEAPCTRADRPERADDLSVCYHRKRSDQEVSA